MPKNPSISNEMDITSRKNTMYWYELRFFNSDKSLDRVCQWIDTLSKNPRKVAFLQKNVQRKYAEQELTFLPVRVTTVPRRKFKLAVKAAIEKRQAEADKRLN